MRVLQSSPQDGRGSECDPESINPTKNIPTPQIVQIIRQRETG